MHRIVWNWDNVQTFLYTWHVLKAWHLWSMEKNQGETSAVDNPTPHISIASILWTMEFTSLTRIGLCIFGTCCASICNQSILSYNFFLTQFMALASFWLWHLWRLPKMRTFMAIWSWCLGFSSWVERWLNLPTGIMKKWSLFACLWRSHLVAKDSLHSPN